MKETSSFQIQKHNTPHPHFDLYLKVGEELRSWIVPNNIPSSKKEIKIAVENETVVKELPETEQKEVIEDAYGSGEAKLWDKGEFTIETQWKSKFIINAKGKKLNGTYLLHIPNWGIWTKKRLWTIEKIK